MTFCGVLNKVKVLKLFVILCFLYNLSYHQGESMMPSAKQQTFEMGRLRFFPWFSCCQVHSSYFSWSKAWRHNYQLTQLACHFSVFPNVEVKLRADSYRKCSSTAYYNFSSMFANLIKIQLSKCLFTGCSMAIRIYSCSLLDVYFFNLSWMLVFSIDKN